MGGVKIVARDTDVTNRDTLREFIDRLRGKGKPVAILLGSEDLDGKSLLTAAMGRKPDLRGVSASDAVARRLKSSAAAAAADPIWPKPAANTRKNCRRNRRRGRLLSARTSRPE